MRSLRSARLLAAVLALATAVLPLNLNVLAAAGATLMGRVTGADGLEPRAGAVVALVDGQGENVYRSAPSDARGAFRLDGAPAGNYRVLVETDAGAYLASSGVALKAGENGPVSLALTALAQETPPEPPPPAPTPAPAPPPPPQQRAKTVQPWAKWVIVGGIALGGAIILNSLSDDSEGSPL